MANSEEVRQMALDLAERGEETDVAVRELLACCGDHRVSVVVARQKVAEAEGEGQDDTVGRAIQLLDSVLERGSWA